MFENNLLKSKPTWVFSVHAICVYIDHDVWFNWTYSDQKREVSAHVFHLISSILTLELYILLIYFINYFVLSNY